jgi:signal transduction histidine kinase
MVGRIKNLVLDILLYAKDSELKKETVSIADFVNDVAKVVEPKIATEHIDFKVDLDASLSTFHVDPGMLSTAIINILENAIDACIDDTSKESHEIIFSAKPENKTILFSIRDNGIGMDRETKENMFSLFYSAKGKKGTGLGLFITRKIIGQHGGSISVDSEKGRGTRIEITIPE